MDNILLLLIGIMFCLIGGLNMTGYIGTVHSYNRRKLKEEDVPKYGKAVGIGMIIMGISFVVDFVLLLFDLELVMTIVTIAAMTVGLAFILYAQFKYNKGIF